MDPITASALIAGGTTVLGSLFGMESESEKIEAQKAMNQANIAHQRWAQRKNEQLMREGWRRDDNAVTRRRADLERAGLSPLLAAGSAAAPSQPANIRAARQEHAPARSYKPITQAIMGGIGAAQTIAEMSRTHAQAAKLDQETFGMRQKIWPQTYQEWQRAQSMFEETSAKYGINPARSPQALYRRASDAQKKQMQKYRKGKSESTGRYGNLYRQMQQQQLRNAKEYLELQSQQIKLRKQDTRLREKQADWYAGDRIANYAGKALGVLTRGRSGGKMPREKSFYRGRR